MAHIWHYPPPPPGMVEGLGIFFSLLFTHISGFNTVCSIAIERYIHIRYRLRWSQILTNTRLNALLIFNAVYSLMIASTFSEVFYGQFVTVNALVTVFDTIVVGVTYAVYLKSYFMTYIKVKSNKVQSGGTSQSRSQSAPEYLPYVAKTVFLILLALSLFYLPYMFVVLFIAVKKKSCWDKSWAKKLSFFTFSLWETPSSTRLWTLWYFWWGTELSRECWERNLEITLYDY